MLLVTAISVLNFFSLFGISRQHLLPPRYLVIHSSPIPASNECLFKVSRRCQEYATYRSNVNAAYHSNANATYHSNVNPCNAFAPGNAPYSRNLYNGNSGYALSNVEYLSRNCTATAVPAELSYSSAHPGFYDHLICEDCLLAELAADKDLFKVRCPIDKCGKMLCYKNMVEYIKSIALGNMQSQSLEANSQDLSTRLLIILLDRMQAHTFFYSLNIQYRAELIKFKDVCDFLKLTRNNDDELNTLVKLLSYLLTYMGKNDIVAKLKLDIENGKFECTAKSKTNAENSKSSVTIETLHLYCKSTEFHDPSYHEVKFKDYENHASNSRSKGKYQFAFAKLLFILSRPNILTRFAMYHILPHINKPALQLNSPLLSYIREYRGQHKKPEENQEILLECMIHSEHNYWAQAGHTIMIEYLKHTDISLSRIHSFISRNLMFCSTKSEESKEIRTINDILLSITSSYKPETPDSQGISSFKELIKGIPSTLPNVKVSLLNLVAGHVLRFCNNVQLSMETVLDEIKSIEGANADGMGNFNYSLVSMLVKKLKKSDKELLFDQICKSLSTSDAKMYVLPKMIGCRIIDTTNIDKTMCVIIRNANTHISFLLGILFYFAKNLLEHQAEYTDSGVAQLEKHPSGNCMLEFAGIYQELMKSSKETLSFYLREANEDKKSLLILLGFTHYYNSHVFTHGSKLEKYLVALPELTFQNYVDMILYLCEDRVNTSLSGYSHELDRVIPHIFNMIASDNLVWKSNKISVVEQMITMLTKLPLNMEQIFQKYFCSNHRYYDVVAKHYFKIRNNLDLDSIIGNSH